MNVAVGGTLGGTPSASTPSPGVLMADYVRQYTGTVAAPTLGNPPAISLKAGATAGNTSTFTPGLAAGSGYVYFTCDTDAPKASCTIATTDALNSHVVNSNAAESVTATVITTANSSLAPPAATLRSARYPRNLPVALLSAVLALLFYLLGQGTKLRLQRPAWMVAAVIAVLLATIAGCGGGGSTTVIPPSNGTAPGSYVIHVYAFTETNTGDGSNAHADAQAAIPLTVN